MELFSETNKVGVFRGFREGGLEFHADIALPYRADMHQKPMHGSFILVRLENEAEAVLGRITSFSSDGRLASASGEDFTIRAVQERREVPEDLREQYLKYRVNIRVLGVLRADGNALTFVPSHRRLPHVGSPVAFPSATVLQSVAGHNDDGALIGNLALGEYVYDPKRKRTPDENWMQLLDPEVKVKFDVSQLISRRTFVFARAGFGKSNLNKLLFSELYRSQPETTKRGDRRVPVGTIIFDPDGEYFWPDDKGRPGLCDVTWLRDKLVVFTSRQAPSAFYGSFTASQVRLDIRESRPSDVISIALPPERQDQQNVSKLRNLSSANWRTLVDLIHPERNNASITDVANLLNLTPGQQDAEAIAARSNMTTVVGLLHDPSSQLMARLLEALSLGKLCVVDISQMRGTQGFILAGIILRQIFTRNQEEFTKQEPRTIPTIAIVEEAQSVLQEKSASSEPFISWVKEGRKYDLGAVLITQQPGSIPGEILSQGDNWFIFHLLSAADLQNLRSANSHFSSDILSSLLNEPIRGQGVFWSSGAGREYPIPVRIASFESSTSIADPAYSGAEVDTFATTLRARNSKLESEARAVGAVSDAPRDEDEPEPAVPDTVVDVLAAREQQALKAVQSDSKLLADLRGTGVRYGTIQSRIANALADLYERPFDVAYTLVIPTVTAVLGKENVGWERSRDADGKVVIRAKQ
jgi:DNA helicase HerA-like ATPase